MTTFTSEPSYGARRTNQPRILAAQFGDGYEQRAADGINTNPQVWDLTFAERSTSEADTITDFLEARGGTEAFDWTNPEGDAGKYVCKTWGRDITGPARFVVTAVFEQRFEA